jgi:hypothetical protein
MVGDILAARHYMFIGYVYISITIQTARDSMSNRVQFLIGPFGWDFS